MRLRSLDVFRGLTIAGMVIVNNPGDWGTVFAPLLHAEWHGWTPTDLIFPFFLFIMGVALAQGAPSRSSPGAVVRRGAILIGLGLFMAGFPVLQPGALAHPRRALPHRRVLRGGQPDVARAGCTGAPGGHPATMCGGRGGLSAPLLGADRTGRAARRRRRGPDGRGQSGRLGRPGDLRHPSLEGTLGSGGLAQLAARSGHDAHGGDGGPLDPRDASGVRRARPRGGRRGRDPRWPVVGHCVSHQQGTVDELLRALHRRRRGRGARRPAPVARRRALAAVAGSRKRAAGGDWTQRPAALRAVGARGQVAES